MLSSKLTYYHEPDELTKMLDKMWSFKFLQWFCAIRLTNTNLRSTFHIILNIDYSLRCKIKVTFRHKVRYEIKVTCGETSLKLRQMNWNVARINVSVVVDELPSQTIIWTCLTIDIWTRRRWRTSMRFNAFRCHPPKMTGFQWNWHQKFLTLLWTPLACRKALSESYATHTILC